MRSFVLDVHTIGSQIETRIKASAPESPHVRVRVYARARVHARYVIIELE